jgi:hypothetical protein
MFAHAYILFYAAATARASTIIGKLDSINVLLKCNFKK